MWISEPDFQKRRFLATCVTIDRLAHFFYEARQVSLFAAHDLIGDMAFRKIHDPRLKVFER